jgi:hypothetical protein
MSQLYDGLHAITYQPNKLLCNCIQADASACNYDHEVTTNHKCITTCFLEFALLTKKQLFKTMMGNCLKSYGQGF